MKKKIVSILLICSMLFTLLPTAAFAAGTVATSGTCGDNLTWKFEDDVLTISGTGEMYSYALTEQPWFNALYGSSETVKVVIKEGVTSIAPEVFYEMNCITAIELPQTLKTIEKNAFSGMHGLQSLTIPDGVISIGKFAFSDCSSLTEVVLPDSLVSIEDSTFAYCSSLTSLDIPDTVLTIGNFAFGNCSSLETVNLSAQLESIGEYAFSGCSALSSIDIPYGTKTIGSNAFSDCTALSDISIPATAEIGGGAFSYCTSLSDVIIPEGITELGDSFRYSGVTNVTLPESLELIGYNAFIGCSNLKEIHIPQNVKEIGMCAFQECPLLEAAYFYGDKPKMVGVTSAYMSFDQDSSIVLYYPADATGWPEFGYTCMEWEPTQKPSGTVQTIITGTNPVNGATNVGYDASDLPEFHIQFNKVPATMNGAGVQIDASKEPFAIYRSSDNKLIWEDPSADLNNEFSIQMAVNTNNAIVTVTPTNAHTLLEKNTEYYITMGAGYIKFEDGTVSPAIKKGDWSFKTKNPDTSLDTSIVSDVTIRTGDEDTKNTVVSVEWDDSWFAQAATTYQHKLAIASMALSGASYVEKNGKPASDKIKEALTAFGFSNIQSYNYGIERTETNNDLVSFSFAAKPVEDNGNAYTLVAVVVKGTSADGEWYSNFNIGQGSQHEGFQICADDIMDLLEVYVDALELDSSNAKFLVTGHSRGAAVANLVAKEITDSSFAQAKNVYGYTFATPAVTTASNTSKYNNIFNIVNGEDFVTRVPLVAWNYKRYGIDLLLPSRSYYGAGYQAVYNAMSEEYSSLVNKAFEPYNGTQKVDRLIAAVKIVAPNVKQFYENKNSISVTPYDYFNSLAEFLVTENPLLLGAYSISDEYVPITAFFVANQVVDKRVLGAHSMVAYYSWLDSCTAKELFGNANEITKHRFKRATIACPVDVYVYDEAGNLVASVVDEAVGGNTLAVSVEEGVKTIDLPDDQEYDIRIIATDNGQVDYTVQEYQATADGDEEQRIVEFTDIAIKGGDELTGNLDNIIDTDGKNYALVKNNSEIIYADYDSKGSSEVPAPEKVETTSMYRLYNPNSGEHFYTGSTEERDMLDRVGWNYEGVAWNAPTKTGAPVYRLYNPNSGDHHYTMSVEERDWLISLGWQYEGVAWNSAGNDNVPQYRLYNPNADCGSHHYTGSEEERDFLVSLGWHFEGIGWYGMLN